MAIRLAGAACALALASPAWPGGLGVPAIEVSAIEVPAIGVSAYEVAVQVPQAQRALLEKNLDLYRWRRSERMDEAQLRNLVDQAPRQVGALLATEGFYGPQVTATLKQVEGEWRVALTVDPGEPVRVRQVDLGVIGAFDDGSEGHRARLEKMRADWSLPRGRVFRHEDWENAKRGALRSLLLEGYPSAHVADSRASVEPDTGSVGLALVLGSGPDFSFGPLEIEGLRRYPASIIQRLNPIHPGEPYAQAKVLELQSRLQDSPYFASADVHMDLDPAHPVQAPIRVTVVENKARTLGLGVGASTDTGPRGRMAYTDLNFLGMAWRLAGNLKVAGKEQSLGGELQFPQTANRYRNSVKAQLDRKDVEGEVTHTLNLGAKRSRLAGNIETSQGISFYREQQDVAGAAGDKRSALVPSWSWTRRDVDSLLYPRRGTVISVQADGAHAALLSDRSFLRGYGKATWYGPVGSHGQLILRGEVGAVAASSRDGIPADFLFRAGGDQTVRGYAYQSLGVKDGNAIVGGRWLAVASAEYVHWLTPEWGAALFLDAGDAADTAGGLDPAIGYGLGARWKSPVGLLGLDLARGRDTGETRLHFAVGFSF